MKRVVRALRFLGRIVVVGLVGMFVTVVGIQYARIIGKNVDMQNRLSATQNDVTQLKAERVQQAAQIRRLSDPLGAIPEIHDKLHLVRGHEAIIYLQHGDGR